METINCAVCNAQINKGSKFCPECGAKISVAGPIQCRECKTPLEGNEKFCPSCGQKIQRASKGHGGSKKSQPAEPEFEWAKTKDGKMVRVLKNVPPMDGVLTNDGLQPSSLLETDKIKSMTHEDLMRSLQQNVDDFHELEAGGNPDTILVEAELRTLLDVHSGLLGLSEKDKKLIEDMEDFEIIDWMIKRGWVK